jgi:hypothetical protein
MTSVTFCWASSSLAFENRSFAAFRSAASKAIGVGGGGGAAAAGGGTGAPVCACAATPARPLHEQHSRTPTEKVAKNIAKASSNSHLNPPPNAEKP